MGPSQSVQWVRDEDGVLVGVRCAECGRVVVAVTNGLCIDCDGSEVPCDS